MRKFAGLEQPPVREAKVRSAAIAAPAPCFVGVKWLSKPAFRMAHKCLFIPLPMDPRRPAIRAMERPAGSVPNRGPEGMTRTCKNKVMRRAGMTGVEAG